MNQLDARLRELLERAIFIPKEQYAEILAADPLTQAEILQELEQMDAIQTRMFGRVLGKAPWFFEALDEQLDSSPAENEGRQNFIGCKNNPNR